MNEEGRNSRNNSNQKQSRSNRRNKKKKGNSFLILLIIIAILLFITAKGTEMIHNAKNANFKFVSQWGKEGITIILKDNAISGEYKPVINEGEVVYPLNFVKDLIDNTIFWDSEAQKLTITNENTVIRMSTDDLTYYVNNEPLELNMPVYNIDGEVFIPHEIISMLYNISTSYNENDKIAILDYDNEGKVIGSVAVKKAKLYTEADKKSRVIKKVTNKEEIVLFNEEGEYTKVRTAEGIPGYILTSQLSDVRQEIAAVQPEEEAQTEEPWKPETGKISLIWDQIFKVGQNSRDAKKIPIEGLNVISPTWFAISDSEGNVSNIADNGYVEWAHSNGYKVWALLSNSFDKQITHDTLSNTDKREKIIRQMLAFVSIYNLDGINIDFESIAEEDGEYYLQFIREITPLLKQQGVTVSVDRYVPSAWTRHYNMEEVGKIVDYVIVMAYDEHWGTSPESGSTASLGWVRTSIENTVAEIPKEKLIMGIPFYTRLWEEKEVDGQLSVSSKAYGMQDAYDNLIENKAEIIFDEETGQNYGQYEKDGALYKIWLEDDQSVEERMKILQEFDLAGSAGWKRGLEKESVWEIINKYLGEK